MDAELDIRTFAEPDRGALTSLWSACGLTRSWNDPDKDIDRKVAHSPDGLLVATIDGVVVGSVMAGYDGHRGWVNYLAASPDHRGAGVGRALMDAAEDHLAGLDCPKINLQIRTSNAGATAFYERIGYRVDEALSMGKRLVDDEVDGLEPLAEPRDVVGN
ncbi:UNVERIFIED_CONTAM: hypothetical protein GTU68_063158 [Idotea baltica]|nr:hypothetical protein [Idotea baltica]